MPQGTPVSVVETPQFLAATKRIMDDDERGLLIDFLARQPLAGEIIAGAGGVRKLRWGLEGRGKRSGARVIYYYHSENMPLFALTAYAKNEKSDLSQADRNAMLRLTSLIASHYSKRTS